MPTPPAGGRGRRPRRDVPDSSRPVHAVVTRDEDPDDGRLGLALRALGAPVLHWSTTSLGPPGDPTPLRRLAETAASYDWVLFTSRRAVEAVAEVVGPAPDGPAVAVVGRKTAEAARAAGWPPDLVAEGTGEAMAGALLERVGPADVDRPLRILYPTTPRAADTVPALLGGAGHAVDRVEAYRTELDELDAGACAELIDRGAVGVVTFTSPSAVEGLTRALPAEVLARLRAAAPAAVIGPTTAEAAEGAGWRTRAADETSLEGVARAAAAVLRERPRPRGDGPDDPR